MFCLSARCLCKYPLHRVLDAAELVDIAGCHRFVAVEHLATEQRKLRVVPDSEIAGHGFGKYLVNLFGVGFGERFIVIVYNGAVFLILQVGGVRVNFAVVDAVLSEKFFEAVMCAYNSHTAYLAKWRGYEGLYRAKNEPRP